MSSASRVTDDEMRYFQFKARQLYLLRKEDHEWNEFCKRNTCTCCSCQPNTAQTNKVPKVNKEVGVQSSLKKIPTISARSTGTSLPPYNRNLSQTLNEIKTKLDKVDLALSELKVSTNSEIKEVTKPKEIFNQRLNALTFPIESDGTESVKSVINERRMQLIQNSLKMSLNRLHAAALRNSRPNSDIKGKKKSSGYIIPRDLERQRAAARRSYLASLKETTAETKGLLHSTRANTDAKKDSLKPKSIKATTKPNLGKFNKSNYKKQNPSLVESSQVDETKDENIETAIDLIMDDLLGETVLVINKIKHLKSEKSSNLLQNREQVPNNAPSRIPSTGLDSKDAEAAMTEQYQNKMEKIKHNLDAARKGTVPNDGKLDSVGIKSSITETKNVIENEKCDSLGASSSIHLKDVAEAKNTHPLKVLSIDPIKAKKISKYRKEYWSYLERISRTRKGNFDPWVLSNMVAESLLEDCLQEIAEELQDVPASSLANLFDQEFLQSI